MKETYFDLHGNCKLLKASRHGVDLLLAYSKSVQITEVEGIHYETNLN